MAGRWMGREEFGESGCSNDMTCRFVGCVAVVAVSVRGGGMMLSFRRELTCGAMGRVWMKTPG